VIRRYPTPTSPAVSAVMRANPSRNTAPERKLRSILHARGYRFRANLRVEMLGLKVRPDIVFTRHRIAVFVDGCFWHACPAHGTRPRANKHYWLPKLRGVVKRDHRVSKLLDQAGWVVLRVWEHMPTERAADLVEAAIQRGFEKNGRAGSTLIG
jgi:DNA mismatch endonuclease, patch repair protein